MKFNIYTYTKVYLTLQKMSSIFVKKLKILEE